MLWQLFLLWEKREDTHPANGNIREFCAVFFCFMGFLNAFCCYLIEFSIDTSLVTNYLKTD